jgi:hypothetical protein
MADVTESANLHKENLQISGTIYISTDSTAETA